MKIGFIGFGEVNEKLSKLLENETLLTSSEGRSIKTINLIKQSKINVLPTFKDVALNSDVLFSATSPKNAVKVASQYGKYCKGIYVDLNNISPKTATKISQLTNSVDASIVGGINNDFTLFLSGENAEKLNFFNKYFPIKIISHNIGDASKLKLLRSIYTKTVATTLIELMEITEDLNIFNELLDTIALTEGEKFKQLAKSRVTNTKKNSKRKQEELLEIIDYFDNYDLEMVKATFNKLSNL